MLIKQLTIIGLGLIGGSVACAIKSTRFCEKIVAFDTNLNSVKQALATGIIDAYETQLLAAVKNADLILIATPLGQFATILSTIKTHIKKTAYITDVCSAKTEILHDAANLLGEQFTHFVPGHPIAGSEKNGFAAAQSDLFANKLVALTPTAKTLSAAIETIKLFWQQMGAKVTIMDAEEHDKLLALTSHLPQLLAYNFMQQVADNSRYPDIFNYTGSGFKDFTRLAGSNPTLWKDICISNRAAILEKIKEFQDQLEKLNQAIDKKDSDKLLEIFSNAKKARDDYVSGTDVYKL